MPLERSMCRRAITSDKTEVEEDMNGDIIDFVVEYKKQDMSISTA